jgi:N-acetylmuramic acid 6-phosphate etherase
MRSKQASNRPPLRLGIECGGTHTVALLVDAAGRVHHRVEAGPANMRLMSDARMIRHFRALARQMDSVTALGIGMAGVLTEADRRRVKQAAAKAWPGVPCWSGNDLETALSAAGLRADESATIVIISGTGSCAYGQNRRGATVKVGGWGHVLGDRGSGYDIGLRALRQVMRYHDQTGRWPKLGQKILVNLLLNRPSDLVSWAQSASKTDLAGLAVTVFEASAAGDPIARFVLRDAAATLAGDALACAHRLAKPGQLVRFSLTGSVLLKQRSFEREVGRQIRTGWRQAIVEPLGHEGAWGAVLRAGQLSCLPHRPEGSRGSGRKLLDRVKERAGSDAFPRALVSIPERDNLIPSATAQSPTERRNPRSMNLDRMPVEQAVRLMIDEEGLVRRALAGCQSQITRGVRMITRALRRGGRLFYVGAGTSGRLGVLDASECPPTFRTPP